MDVAVFWHNFCDLAGPHLEEGLEQACYAHIWCLLHKKVLCYIRDLAWLQIDLIAFRQENKKAQCRTQQSK
jgi:hypothetical protein